MVSACSRILTWMPMRFLKQDGQDIVEYALLIGFMALALTASLNSVASAISNVFTTVGGTLNDAV